MRIRTLVVSAMGALLALTLPFVTCLNYLEVDHVAVTWNLVNGDIGLQDHAGWHARKPWVLISPIDTRPQRVCITTASHAAVNCKLVSFIPSEYKRFVAVEGFRWYWWSNRFSVNFGYREEYRGMRDILRGYAFSAEQYPFVKATQSY